MVERRDVIAASGKTQKVRVISSNKIALHAELIVMVNILRRDWTGWNLDDSYLSVMVGRYVDGDKYTGYE